MSAALVLLTATPLRVTLLVLAVAGGVVVFLLAIVVLQHARSTRYARHRERVEAELGPVFSRFFETKDRDRLAGELRPAFMRMDAAERPVAAAMVTEYMAAGSFSERGHLRHGLEESGIVELGHRGTRRLSPWRRALACEMLGKIGSPRSVPVLLERVEDRRPEVRMAAVRALGDIGSEEAVPALSAAFLERRCAPTDVLNDALRRIGGGAARAFEHGTQSPDPVIRISSCFGLAGIAGNHGGAVHQLADVLASDPDPSVRAAAASAIGIRGGQDAPVSLIAASADPDDRVRRNAVRALGAFDDPLTLATLDERTEDQDREVALRAAEALVRLSRRPRAGIEARARVESSSAWAVRYAQKIAEVTESAREPAEGTG